MIVVGAVVGWLAGLIVKGSGYGFWGDVLIGIGGSILGWVHLSFGRLRGRDKHPCLDHPGSDRRCHSTSDNPHDPTQIRLKG